MSLLRHATTALVVSAMLASSGGVAKAQATELPPWLAGQANETATEDTVDSKTKSQANLPGWKKDRIEQAALFKETPADVVISAVLAEPIGRQREFVQLKNLGGQTQDLEGWKLTLTNGEEEEESFVFGNGKDGCPSKIDPLDSLLVLKKSPDNPCGFEFKMGPSENLVLFEAGADAEGVDSMTWGNVGQGIVLYRSSDDSYEKAPQNVEGDVLNTLQRLGGFNSMITFLRHFGLDNILEGRGVRHTDKWHNKIVREMDYDIPYTLFAIKDEQWEKFFKDMAGEWAPPLTAPELLEIDDALVFDIITFLMVQESWNSRSLNLKMGGKTSMAFPTAHPDRKAVLQLDDSGTIRLNYDCVDSPSPDEFGCAIQRGWGKCQEDWMNDNGFFSGRPLGYCEYECEKCYCDPLEDNCAKTVITDVTASSGKKGIVHVIDRLIEAPPIMPEWVAMDENGNPIEKKKVEKKKEKKKEKKEEKKSSSSGGSSGGSRRTYGYYNPWWGK